MVQWLRLQVPNGEGLDSIPGQELDPTKIENLMCHNEDPAWLNKQLKKKKNRKLLIALKSSRQHRASGSLVAVARRGV